MNSTCVHLLTMGKGQSKEIDSTGTVNNNVILTNTVNVYSQELVYLLAVLVALKILEIMIFMYLKHKRHLKMDYMNRGGSNPA